MKLNLKSDHEYICIHDYDSLEQKMNTYAENAEDKELTDKLKSITPVRLLHFCMEL